MDPRLKNLDYVFKPRSVAFIGATETPAKWGNIIYNNLITGGYGGKIHPVNPGRESVMGLKAYPSVADIPGEVDMAVFTIPAAQVPVAISDCVKKGVKAAVVISAGFKELGGEFAGLEEKITSIARAGNMVLVGPNGQGVCCPETKLYPWIPPHYRPPHGEVAVVSQSGNIQTLLIAELVKAGFGVSKSASSGNEADIKTADYIEYFAQDDASKAILAYIEGIADGRGFVDRARRAAMKKPVIVLKGGATGYGVAAARSHTGSMAVSDRIFDSACRQAGLIRAERLDDAGILASSFLNRPLPKGRRVAIITGGGGLGVVAADACAKLGLELPALSEGTLKKIGELMPEWWAPGNPVDMVAGLRFGTRKPIMEILMQSGEVDSVMLIRMGQPPRKLEPENSDNDKAAEIVKGWDKLIKKQLEPAFDAFDLMNEYGIPTYVVSNLYQDCGIDPHSLFGDKRVTVYQHIETACLAVSAMARYGEFLAKTGAH